MLRLPKSLISSSLFVCFLVPANAQTRGSSPVPTRLTLAEAYALALPRSEDVRLAQYNVKDAQARQLGVWAQVGPQASVGAVVQAQNEVIIFTRVNFARPEQLQVGGSLNQPLFRRGVFDARRAERYEVAFTQSTLERARSQLMMDVVSSFLGMLQARQRIQLALGSLARAQGQLTDARGRVKAGGGLKTTEMLANVEVSRAELAVAAAKGEERNQAATFERLVGVSPPEVLELPSSPTVPALEEAIQAADKRSDLVAQQHRVVWSQAVVQQQKARFWPTLDAQLGFTYFLPAGLTDFAWYARAVMSVPLFQTGDEWLQLKLQRSKLAQVELQRDLAHKQITEEVKKAINRVSTAREEALIAGRQVLAAQQHYTLVNTQFRLGGITFLEVINAQGLLTEAEVLQLGTKYEYELATYSLLFADGALKL